MAIFPFLGITNQAIEVMHYTPSLTIPLRVTCVVSQLPIVAETVLMSFDTYALVCVACATRYSSSTMQLFDVDCVHSYQGDVYVLRRTHAGNYVSLSDVDRHWCDTFIRYDTTQQVFRWDARMVCFSLTTDTHAVTFAYRVYTHMPLRETGWYRFSLGTFTHDVYVDVQFDDAPADIEVMVCNYMLQMYTGTSSKVCVPFITWLRALHAIVQTRVKWIPCGIRTDE